MPNGFFQGGMAEGMQTAELLSQRQDALDQKAAELRAKRDEARSNLVNKRLETTASVIDDIITEGRKSRAPNEVIFRAVAPLRASLNDLATKAGVDATPYQQRFDAKLGLPVGAADPEKPLTELGKLKADRDQGFISQADYDARVRNLTREVGQPNVMEGIRQKLSRGDALTPGEKQVYDDAIKFNPIARMLSDALGQPPAAASPAAPSVPPARPDPLGMRR